MIFFFIGVRIINIKYNPNEVENNQSISDNTCFFIMLEGINSKDDKK